MPFIKIIILPLTLLLLIAGLSVAEPIRIEFGHMGGLDSSRGKAGAYFKKLVEQRSNGRIQISINPENPTDDRHSIEMLRINNIQLAAPDISECYTLNPQLRLFELPFFFNDIKQLHKVMDGEVGTELLEIASQGEFVALSFWDNGLRQLTANQPLRRPEQAQGLRLHIQDSAVLREFFLQLGAKPQTIPPAQLYTALKDKIIDGQENTLSSIDEQNLYKVQSDLTISNHSYSGFLIVTNKHFWSQLPEDLKVILRGAIKSAAEYTRDIAIQINEEALKKISATNQIKIHLLSQEERRLWDKKFQESYPEPYNKLGNDLVRKAREHQIR